MGIKDQVAGITERAMNGELDFKDALRERVGLLKGLPKDALQEVYASRITAMEGAQTLVRTMKKHGAYCLLVSGGFTFFTQRVRMMLGFDEDQSNQLLWEHDALSGEVAEPILDKESKWQSLLSACAKLEIDATQALAVGDGANDLPMLLAAGLGVAYHAKPVVQAQAHAVINHHDLSALLYVQGYAKDQWAS
jgi:phosphoserine phosphatase